MGSEKPICSNSEKWSFIRTGGFLPRNASTDVAQIGTFPKGKRAGANRWGEDREAKGSGEVEGWGWGGESSGF